MSKIVDVKVKVLEIPLKTPWQTFLYATATRAHCVVRVVTEDGIFGYGEASPAAAFMGETAYTMETVINMYLKQAAVGQSVLEISRINDLMDQVIAGNTSAKAAVDIAVHDAAGKTLKVPVYVLLGGKSRQHVELAWSMGFKDFDASLEEAKEYIRMGFKIMKVKVGKNIEEDAKLVGKLREIFGPDVPIRMDANQGYTPGDAIGLLNRVARFSPESFEQPVRKWNLEGMRHVRDHSCGIPIMADESISSLHEAHNTIQAGCADYYNIKVGKVGGLYRACQVAAMVEAAGYQAAAGSNLELGIGEAASIHFIVSQPAVCLPSDALCGTGLHTANLVKNPMTMQGGVLNCPELPGLGVEVDEGIFK
ncbi:MAG: enolase C-terminal domain-like protein [Aminivibrio sp.]|uniref:mandelate racemase/muconate lactonizing enzyme family protein n=1 Tax=Aminivibrio sp. TaxID=1872489 RepID=UPI002B1EE0A9|nr:enolase C-terminal domain-like protein [Aminivibrio sp.]MEA4952610.1 enolase C-terminal domain-like protein [Aminivibrio sp.]